MTVNPHSVRYVKMPSRIGSIYAVYAFSGEVMDTVCIGVVSKDPRGWVFQMPDADKWFGIYPTRGEAADSLVWHANRVTV